MADAFIFNYQHRTRRKAASSSLRLPPVQLIGDGYLAGEFPGGITTLDGVPVPATVRAHLRSTGQLVAEVQSAADGTWKIEGLNAALAYDVIGRKAGYNDVIKANVRPAPMNFDFSLTSSLAMNEDQETVSGAIIVNNGTSPFSISVVEGALPAGLSFAAQDADRFILQGASAESGRFALTVEVTDSQGFLARLPLVLGPFLAIRPVDESKTRFIALLDALPGSYRTPAVDSPSRTFTVNGELVRSSGKVPFISFNNQGYLVKPFDAADARYYSDGIASIWFRVTKPLPSNPSGLVSFYTDDYGRITSITMSTAGNIVGGIQSFYGSEAHTTPGRYDDGNWHHAVLMFWRSEGSHINLVIDNQLVYTGALQGLADAAGGLREVQVGRDGRLFGPVAFPGDLTRLRYAQLRRTPQQGQNIWNDLPENRAQVAELYNEVAAILRPEV